MVLDKYYLIDILEVPFVVYRDPDNEYRIHFLHDIGIDISRYTDPNKFLLLSTMRELETFGKRIEQSEDVNLNNPFLVGAKRFIAATFSDESVLSNISESFQPKRTRYLVGGPYTTSPLLSPTGANLAVYSMTKGFSFISPEDVPENTTVFTGSCFNGRYVFFGSAPLDNEGGINLVIYLREDRRGGYRRVKKVENDIYNLILLSLKEYMDKGYSPVIRGVSNIKVEEEVPDIEVLQPEPEPGFSVEEVGQIVESIIDEKLEKHYERIADLIELSRVDVDTEERMAYIKALERALTEGWSREMTELKLLLSDLFVKHEDEIGRMITQMPNPFNEKKLFDDLENLLNQRIHSAFNAVCSRYEEELKMFLTEQFEKQREEEQMKRDEIKDPEIEEIIAQLRIAQGEVLRLNNEPNAVRLINTIFEKLEEILKNGGTDYLEFGETLRNLTLANIDHDVFIENNLAFTLLRFPEDNSYLLTLSKSELNTANLTSGTYLVVKGSLDKIMEKGDLYVSHLNSESLRQILNVRESIVGLSTLYSIFLTKVDTALKKGRYFSIGELKISFKRGERMFEARERANDFAKWLMRQRFMNKIRDRIHSFGVWLSSL